MCVLPLAGARAPAPGTSPAQWLLKLGCSTDRRVIKEQEAGELLKFVPEKKGPEPGSFRLIASLVVSYLLSNLKSIR